MGNADGIEYRDSRSYVYGGRVDQYDLADDPVCVICPCSIGSELGFSTVLLQKRTKDTFRGRIFSTEWLLFTLANSLSVIVASLILEFELVTVKQLILIYGALMGLAGLIWTLTITRKEKIYQLTYKHLLEMCLKLLLIC